MAGEVQIPIRDRVARVVIVDDHELARLGLRRMLEGERDIAVVGEASNGIEAITVCTQVMPDIVLMDVRMPAMDGLTATEQIQQRLPRTSVLVITVYEDQEYILRAIRAGASGYILKDASRREVLSTIRRVLDGESVLAPSLSMRVLQRLTHPRGEQVSAPREMLTPRETDVLRLVVDGYTNQEIALHLSIGSGTVKTHVEHIISKLGASSRTQAAVRAVQRGLVAPPVCD